MSIPYYNRSAPFWDFVANLEDGAMNPSSSEDPRYRGGEGPFGHGASPWDWAWRGPWGRQSHPHHHPPPHPHGQDSVREGGEDDGTTTLVGDQDMTDGEKEKHEDNGVPTEERGEKREGKRRECGGEKREGGGERRECGGEKRGGCHGRRGGPHAHGSGRGRCEGGRGRGGPHFGFRRGPPGPWNMRGMAEQLFGGPQDAEGGHSRTNDDGVELFVPPVDVFDTEEAYVVHASLAGAKKEDVAVSWDAEKSELGISGVIHRPGDEELLKRLALDERKAGMFERKVRLGSRMTPAKVDADGITAKLEDGVLRIEVPKEDGEFVEVKKVDVE